ALSVTEDLIATNPFPPPTAPLPGTRLLVRDAFDTTNTFDGGQLGLAGESWRGPWFAAWYGQVALGSVSRVATVSGGTRVTPPVGGATEFAGGLLAQPTNSGRHASS